MEEVLEAYFVDSLEKVFPEIKPPDSSFCRDRVLLGEVYSFQIVWKYGLKQHDIKIESQITGLDPQCLEVRRVGLSPSEMYNYSDHDNFTIYDRPGLYPDPLFHFNKDEPLKCIPNQWRSLWITVRVPENTTAEDVRIDFSILESDGSLLKNLGFSLNIIQCILPKGQIINTQWFHADCLASYYDLGMYSEEHWDRIEQQFINCNRHGMNLLLTPVFTLPLDTKVGGERPNHQLVKICCDNNRYSFDFTLLVKWIYLAKKSGINKFELSHFATQWGAKYCPKIMVEEKGKLIKKFGWEKLSLSDEYKEFLDQFLPSLDQLFRDLDICDDIYVHISDEPELEHLKEYKKFGDYVRDRLQGYKYIDALSSIDIYNKGAMPKPIPALDFIEPFKDLPDLWSYYCCAQYKDVPNRFFAMPSVRNRVLGVLLYKYNIKGFLHWGYNFYYSRFSTKLINPFYETDADGGFPSGDAYLVYPGKDGPIDSIRYEVYYEALQDYHLLLLLEKHKGRDYVLLLLEENLTKPLSMKVYPHEKSWLLGLRDRVITEVVSLTS